MLVTDPTGTPWNSTGEPTVNPLMGSSKYKTYLLVFLKNLPEPNTTRLAAIMITARTTKPPIIILFACLAICVHPIG